MNKDTHKKQKSDFLVRIKIEYGKFAGDCELFVLDKESVLSALNCANFSNFHPEDFTYDNMNIKRIEGGLWSMHLYSTVPGDRARKFLECTSDEEMNDLITSVSIIQIYEEKETETAKEMSAEEYVKAKKNAHWYDAEEILPPVGEDVIVIKKDKRCKAVARWMNGSVLRFSAIFNLDGSVNEKCGEAGAMETKGWYQAIPDLPSIENEREWQEIKVFSWMPIAEGIGGKNENSSV